MKFSEFYNDAQQELTSTFISMYAKGKPEYAEHLRWIFANEKEKLIQDPVFQSIFPWELYDKPMGKLTDLFGKDFIGALDKAKEPLDDGDKEKNMPFPKNPYKHQVASWEAVLKENKSIVVTTGTGSGKTECFMAPVLKQLYEDRIKSNGINPGVEAIFLYPLNALIASQRKRIHAWCNSLSPKVTYGIYTGETLDEVRGGQPERDNSYPQIVDRKSLRENPPQILFTNPTILDYLMIRSRDQELVEKSPNLKWIILDEAHTYNGSAATEMAILLRRVLQLFGKKPSEVNFALTSATIGEGKQEEMNSFISKLTGKDAKRDFSFISGTRIIPELDNENNAIDSINREFNLNITLPEIIKLRKKLNSVPALSLKEICDDLKFSGTTEERLKLVDALSVSGSAKVNGEDSALLPVRAHFFGRSVSGLYACTNPECTQYKKNHIDIGTLTTMASQTCPHCGGKMLEVVRCGSCGEFLLQGGRTINNNIDGDPTCGNYFMKDNTFKFHHWKNDDSPDNFEIPSDDDDDDENDGNNHVSDLSTEILLSAHKNDIPFEGANVVQYHLDSKKGIINKGEGYTYCYIDNNLLCPSCGEKADNCNRIIFSSSFESRLLAHTFLKQSPKDDKNDPNSLICEGRKYITFTDNRQGTANISKNMNISVEREWMRSTILYDLINRYNEVNRNNVNEDQASIDWDDILRINGNDNDLRSMLKQLGHEIDPQVYLMSMFIDQMGNKPLRSNSLETLGLVHLDYPAINNLGINSVPVEFYKFFDYTDKEKALKDWKDFLRICLDYQIRRNMHIIIPNNNDLRKILTQTYFSDPIYSPDINIIERNNGIYFKRWPKIRQTRQNDSIMSRLPLLLLLSKGIVNDEDLTEGVENSVNEILSDAWNFLAHNVLSDVNEDLVDRQNDNKCFPGYKLDIFDEQKVKLSLIDNVTVCPMTSQILDCTFRGISPMVKGHLDRRTLEKYKIQLPVVEVPKLNITKNDFTKDGVFNHDEWENTVSNWFDSTFVRVMKPLGGDFSVQRQLFLKRPIYIIKEHSAQIKSKDLRLSEKLFNEGKVNVLSCSTTMEMGVDIDGISAVLMNNVPPKPANYLQRTGRAGRRAETQLLSLTLCNDNPIGNEVLDNPKWALEHDIEAPRMSFSSSTIMQRHINSLLLGEYIRSTGGGNLTDQIGAFIYGYPYNDSQNIIYYTFDGFKAFLQNIETKDILDKIKDIIKGTVYETETFDRMISQAEEQIDKICSELKGTIDELQQKRQNAQGRFARMLDYRKKALWTKNFITYLSSQNFLPSSSLPTNVVELVVPRKNQNNDIDNIQRPLSMAIQEYAPGKEVVVNNFVYPIEGIEKKFQISEDRSLEKHISKCENCGNLSINSIDVKICPKCGYELKPYINKQRGNSTLSVEPLGFIAGEGKRTKKPNLSYGFIEPELLGMEQWGEEENDSVYRIRASVHADAQILYINKGNGFGYAFCETCGKMEPESCIVINNRTSLPAKMEEHTDITKGKRCYGNNAGIKRNVLLSACYHTDISEMEIKFDSHDEHDTLLKTLGTIICSTFTTILGIEDDELWFGITPKDTLFFYDTASGGAGYANQLPLYIEKVFDKCREKLEACDCKIACTHCLIDRKSQRFLEDLDRMVALKWLKNEYDKRQIIPSELKGILETNNISKITRDITSELSKRIEKNDYNKIYYFLKKGLAEDDLLPKIEQDLLITHLQKANVTMVVAHDDATDNNLSLGIRMELNTYGNRFSNRNDDGTHCSSLKAVESAPAGIIPIALFSTDSTEILYLKYENSIYYAEKPKAIILKNYVVNLVQEPTEVCFVKNFNGEKVQSSLLMTELLGNNYGLLTKFLNGKNKRVFVKYTDIFISNPMSCIILSQILRKFAKDFNLSIIEVNIKTGKQFKDSEYYRRTYLDTDFEGSEERNKYLKESITYNLDGVECSIDDNEKLPHARLLTIYNSDFEIIINPDAGFGYGWKAFHTYRNDVENNRAIPIELTNIKYRDGLSIRFTIGWRNKKQ